MQTREVEEIFINRKSEFYKEKLDIIKKETEYKQALAEYCTIDLDKICAAIFSTLLYCDDKKLILEAVKLLRYYKWDIMCTGISNRKIVEIKEETL